MGTTQNLRIDEPSGATQMVGDEVGSGLLITFGAY
jgi:hypothetical protein